MTVDEFDITVRSWRLHAQRWGSPSAPLLIGLPGLSGTIKSYGYLGSQLGGEALQLVALDLRGRGKSETTPPGTYGWGNHGCDVLAIADALGFGRFAVCGQSMGGSVAIKVAELAPERLDGVVLIDVAGRVDPGVGAVIAEVLDRVRAVYPSADDLLGEVRSDGLIHPWSEHWDAAYRYDLQEVDGGVRSRASIAAIDEDRAYTWTQDPYARWKYLTMPTLLLRASREMRPGAGFVVPADDCRAFRRDVARSEVVEVDANHITITAHPETASAIATFLAGLGS